MELLELVKQVEVKINNKVDEFSKIGKDIKVLYKQIEEQKKKAYKIVVELQPVEYLVYQHNPQLKDLFEALKEEQSKNF